MDVRILCLTETRKRKGRFHVSLVSQCDDSLRFREAIGEVWPPMGLWRPVVRRDKIPVVRVVERQRPSSFLAIIHVLAVR